jgi:preprotein translocase subunit SecA
MRHYDVQIWGAVAMHQGAIVEMQTGEGKTLTATLPLFLHGLVGEGAHLATANDYLARRDAEWMRPLYQMLGYKVAAIESVLTGSRQEAYDADVTYGTAKEFGFDFLRDRLRYRAESARGCRVLDHLHGSGDSTKRAEAQRGLHFALVDEADSILVDEARTPLIVSSLPGLESSGGKVLFHWAAELAPTLIEHDDYDLHLDTRQVMLTPVGRRRVRVFAKPSELHDVGLFDLYEHVERAVLIQRTYQRDRHYVIRQGDVVIVDEATGRLAEGRQWRDGIHQAIQARENVEITPPTADAARVTMQNFFGQYTHLAGMTGTVHGARRELRSLYNARVQLVPTNQPPRRTRWKPRVLADENCKWEAICEEVRDLAQTGRPVLIGTRSIDRSETLSECLRSNDIEHAVLNARHAEAEAEIIAQAGQRGRVTVATNMAGRGTDIVLQHDVLLLGGLHVICSELHESSRIDRQLVGRCGRQGDPGSYRHYFALDDEVLALGFGEAAAKRIAQMDPARRSPQSWAALFLRAQRRIQSEHFRQRRLLQCQEKQRLDLQNQMGLDPFMDAVG